MTFQNSLRNQMLNIPTVPAYFLQGNRKLSILHARLRNDCNDSNGYLYLNHLRNGSICACGNSNESSLHFLLECERFSNQRILKFRETRPFHPLSVNYLFLVNQIYLTIKILFFFRLSTDISKTQRGLYRQPYTTVHTVREQNGGSQPLLYCSSFYFIFPLFSFVAHFLSFPPSFLSLVFFFFFFFVFRRHFCGKGKGFP